MHYSLIIAEEDDRFIGFDPLWWRAPTQEERVTKFKKYCGLINVEWEEKALLKHLDYQNCSWVHLIYPGKPLPTEADS